MSYADSSNLSSVLEQYTYGYNYDANGNQVLEQTMVSPRQYRKNMM
ncbi:MAG: hypothetical protein HFG28_06595 [Eubacterium sp.]|nr:hypothetical protein [Eubacterium sp.]